MTDSEKQRITDLCYREAEGTNTMLFPSEGGDAKSSMIQTRTQRRRSG